MHIHLPPLSAKSADPRRHHRPRPSLQYVVFRHVTNSAVVAFMTRWITLKNSYLVQRRGKLPRGHILSRERSHPSVLSTRENNYRRSSGSL
jgi:hypothetical protein